MLKRLCLSAAALAAFATPAQADELRSDIAADMPALMKLYRDLHAHPELSFEEVRTAKLLAERMRALGFEVTEGVGKTGVVSVMKNGEGPTVMLRADMDGLPVVEQTGLPFASKQVATPASGVTTGVMHACGHDTHMAAFIGAAHQLTERKDEWQGTLVMILQPAEEIGLGAKPCSTTGSTRAFQARLCRRLPRCGGDARRGNRLFARLCAGQCRQRRHHHSRRRRAWRLSAHGQRTRSCWEARS